MQFTNVVALALAPAVMALPSLAPRDASQVLYGIQTISNSISTLNDTLNTFKPDYLLSLPTALKIQTQTDDLGTAIMQARTQTDSAAPFTDDESNSVALAVVTLQPDIASLLDNIVVHKPAFASALLLVGDLSQTVRADLVKQSNYTSGLGTAITNKLAPPYNQFAPIITGQIQGYFDAAIQAYDACTGLICLPPVPF